MVKSSSLLKTAECCSVAKISTAVPTSVRYLLLKRIELSADVFNLFNANNQSGFANPATTSNQVQFGGGAPFVQRNAGPPRQFQFGIAYKF